MFRNEDGNDRYDSYKPRQRMIYRYWDGARFVQADPLALWKSLMAVGPEIDVDSKVAASKLKDAPKAHTSMVLRIRNIFRIRPLVDGVGCEETLSDSECVDLLNHFMTYCGRQKKSASPPATFVRATPPTSVPSSDASPPTPSSSDSGSTGGGLATGPAGPSTSGSASPSECSTPASATGAA